jgi:acyl-coenzyme A synthetase/AMP-(fatty) acid ligase
VLIETNEPAFILAPSGTPNLAAHTHGGYAVHIHATGRWRFVVRPNEVWWSVFDIDWMVGHSGSSKSQGSQAVGLMFWLTWNRLVGSYRFLTATRRS